MITIKTLDVPSAIELRNVVSKIRRYTDPFCDPDGYFTYQEIPNKGYGDHDAVALVPSQYFLGEGDIDILTKFLDSSDKHFIRSKHWQRSVEGLSAEFEITAPITFWALTGFRELILDKRQKPNWDFNNYGKVAAEEFLESLTITGTAAFNYNTLAILRRYLMNNNELPLSKVMIPWIEQLPYADIFICNSNLYVEDKIT